MPALRCRRASNRTKRLKSASIAPRVLEMSTHCGTRCTTRSRAAIRTQERGDVAVLTSKVDSNASAFQANDAHHRALSAQLRDLAGKVALGGDERSRNRHVERG